MGNENENENENRYDEKPSDKFNAAVRAASAALGKMTLDECEDAFDELKHSRINVDGRLTTSLFRAFCELIIDNR